MNNYTGSLAPDTIPMEFDVIVDIIPKYTTEEIKSAIHKGFLPDGEVISGLRSAIITYQIEVDHYSFIESVEDLLTEYYELELLHNGEPYNYSYHYVLRAKDKKDDKVYFNFSFRLRINNQPEVRTETLNNNELAKDISKCRQSYYKRIYVNNVVYNTYEDAFIDIDTQVEHQVNDMRCLNT